MMIRQWMQTILLVLALIPLTSDGSAVAQSSLPPVWSVAWSSGGAYVAFGFDGGTGQVLNAATGLVMATRQLSSHRISTLAWRPSEPVLAAGAFDGQITLWNPITDEVIHLYDGDEAVDAITWDQSGYYLASANEDTIYGPYTVKIWDMRTRNVIQTFLCSSRIRDLAWSPYGTRLALAGDTVIIIDPKTGEQIAELDEHQSIASVDWNDNGSQLVSAGGSDDTVRVWDMNTGQAVSVIPLDFTKDAQFSPDGKILAIADRDKIYIVDASTQQNLEIIEGASGTVEVAWSPVAMSPNGSQLAYGTADGQTHIVTVDLGKNPPSLWSVAWSSDGTSVAFGFDGGTVQLYDGDTHLISMARQLSRERISSLAWKPSELLLAAGALDGQILLWNPITDEVVHLYDGDNAVYALSWSSDGRYLASANEDTSYGPYTVKIWDIGARNVIQTFHFSFEIEDIEWSPRQNRLALAGKTIVLFDTTSWQQVAELNHLDVIHIHWNADGSRLISASVQDENVCIWDPSTGQALTVIPTELVWDAQFSPNGTALAISDGSKIRIVDILTQQNLEVIENVRTAVEVVWSPDSTQLAYSASDQAHFATVELDSAP